MRQNDKDTKDRGERERGKEKGQREIERKRQKKRARRGKEREKTRSEGGVERERMRERTRARARERHSFPLCPTLQYVFGTCQSIFYCTHMSTCESIMSRENDSYDI